jgi:hypothetical protein
LFNCELYSFKIAKSQIKDALFYKEKGVSFIGKNTDLMMEGLMGGYCWLLFPPITASEWCLCNLYIIIEYIV